MGTSQENPPSELTQGSEETITSDSAASGTCPLPTEASQSEETPLSNDGDEKEDMESDPVDDVQKVLIYY